MQRDYILRQIEILGRILQRIRDMITGGATREAATELSRAARQAGADLELAQGLTGESLIGLLSPAGEPDAARCMLFAEVLYVDGLRASAEGAAEEARNSFAKSLLLFETACTATPVVKTPEVRAKIEELEQRLAQ